MPVDLRCRSARARMHARRLRSDAAGLIRAARLEEFELSVMLVGDRRIRRLNREYRDRDAPTDVLSFSQLEDARRLGARGSRRSRDRPPVTIGDIVISIDTAERQARELGISVGDRLRTLLIHGLLHLIGYDHERSTAEARRMFARERALRRVLDRREANQNGSAEA